MIPKSAIGLGLMLWLGGLTLYTLSATISLLASAEQQAHWALAPGLPMLACVGAKLYHNKGSHLPPLTLGLIFSS